VFADPFGFSNDDAFGFSTSLRSPGLSPGINCALNEIYCLAFNLSPSRSPEAPVGSFGFGLGGSLISFSERKEFRKNAPLRRKQQRKDLPTKRRRL
jgi:hypothetical protein